MPTAEARVQTSRADRYLAQLCEHLGRLQHGPPAGRGRSPGASHGPAAAGHASPPVVRHIEQDATRAQIEFDWGTCALAATSAELVVQVHADNPGELALGQWLLGGRIETIGRRDRLSVEWQAHGSA